MTGLVGREHELEALRALLRQGARLVTLVGPPGVGKTRLALAAAERLAGDFGGGVRTVPLADVRDPALVLPAIARALDVARSDADAIQMAVGAQRLLLVLDNLEQLPDAAPVVGALVQECPRLVVLATSRAPLRLAAEQELPLEPLALPREGADDPDEVGQSPAVELFVQRARAVRPAFGLTAENAAAVGALCRRLDGLPLALELAAARTRLLPAATILAQLQQSEWGLPLLAGGPRDAPARHRTVREAIDWSYALLSEDERRVFRRLGVCAGGCTLEAAAVVCLDGPTHADAAARVALLEQLAALAAHSLLRPEAGERLGMLELVREYALERLAAEDDATATRWRHARHFLALAEEAQGALKTAAQAEWLERVAREHANIEGALEWLLAVARGGAYSAAGTFGGGMVVSANGHRGGEGGSLGGPGNGDESARGAELGLRLAGALWWYWHLRGQVLSGREWLAAFLALPAVAAPTALRAQALFALGFLTWSVGFVRWEPRFKDAAARAFEESLVIFRALGDRHGEAYATWGEGLTLYRDYLGSEGRGRQEEVLRASLSLFQEAGDLWGVAKAYEHLGNAAYNRRDRREACRLWEEGLAAARALGEPQSLGALLRQLGRATLREGDLATARELLEESAAVLDRDALVSPQALTHNALGAVALAEGRLPEAEARFLAAHAAARRRASRVFGAEALMGLGGVAAAAGDWERALELAGGAIALWQPVSGGAQLPLPVSAATVATVAARLERSFRWMASAREAVGGERARALLVQGARTPVDALLSRRAITAAADGTAGAARTAGAAGTTGAARSTGDAPQPGRGRNRSSGPVTGGGGNTLRLPGPAATAGGGAEAGQLGMRERLTPREQETAALIAAGMSNREIARELTITERTVMRHVEHILAKLGLRSRTQIAVWVLEHRDAERL